MATTEERVDKLEMRFATLEQQVATVASKVDMVIGELQQQREDIRRAQEKHDADMRELREDSRRAQEKHDADMREMREDIKGTIKHIQNLTIASMVGIAAIAIATWVFVLTNNHNVAPPPNPPAQTAQVQNNQ